MHLICTIFLALLNGTASKIDNMVFKVIATTILLTFTIVMGYFPAVLKGFEFYNMIDILNLSVNKDFLIFITAISIPFVLSKNFQINIDQGVGYWLVLTYIFSLTLSASVFTSTVLLLLVWLIYFYFFEKQKSLLEQIIIHIHVFVAFIIYKNLFIGQTEILSNALYLSSTFLLVNQCKKLSNKKLTNTNVLMLLIYMLYTKSLFTHISPGETILSVSMFMSVYLTFNHRLNSSGLFVMLFYFLWLTEAVSSLAFVFILIGSLFWSQRDHGEPTVTNLTNLKLLKNAFYLAPTFLIPMIINEASYNMTILLTLIILFFMSMVLLLEVI